MRVIGVKKSLEWIVTMSVTMSVTSKHSKLTLTSKHPKFAHMKARHICNNVWKTFVRMYGL